MIHGRNIAGVPPKQRRYGLGATHDHPDESGSMTVVLPHGALFRKGAEGKIRKALLEQDLIEAVIGVGPNIFYGTQLCGNRFRKNKSHDKKAKVLFIDGADQVRVGRAQNFLEKEHVEQLYQWYQANVEVETMSM